MAKTPREITAEILSGLNVLEEFRALGVEIIGEPRASGMVSCRAWGREDRKPSAWINIRSGFYGDAGGKDVGASTCSLFDFSVKVGKFSDWKEARKFYAQKAGVELGRGRPAGGKDDWHNRLILQSWDTPGNDVLALRWCLQHKPGVTVEAIKAAGGQMAYYPCHWDKEKKEVVRNANCRQVIAIPCYGEWLLDAEPVAWVCWDITGQPFDVTPKEAAPSDPRVTVKMVSVGPTRGTVMGLSAIMALADPDRRAAIEWVWKVEGPADMLALWATIPEEQRGRHIVVTNAGGATSDVYPHQAKLLAGLKVAVCGDCDEAGQVGAAKWLRALSGLTTESKCVVLPWPIKHSHGEDVRDFLAGAAIPPEPPVAGGRSYADLLTLAEAAQAWQPSEAPSAGSGSGDAAGATPGALDSTPASAGSVSDEQIDTYHDLEVARALQIDVLGTRSDGGIEVWSVYRECSVVIQQDVAKIKYDNLLKYFSTPVRRCVLRANQDHVPGFYSVAEVREALAHLASKKDVPEETKLGMGCWLLGNHEEDETLSEIVLVNPSDAANFNGSFQPIKHPRHKDRILAFEHGAQPWFDFGELGTLLEQAEDPHFRKQVCDELVAIFARWRWGGKTDPLIVAGLVMATWVQSAWSWRPRIDILGESGTGKSMLCECLAGIFKNLVISTADTTFAGLAQEMQQKMAAVIVDEIDAKDKESRARQRQIIKGLRSASRGTVRIRGTGGQKATKFTLKHLAWVAGISMNYDDQADRNRAVILNLEKPTKELAGKLVLPSPEDLHAIGQRSLAVALWAIGRARLLAVRLKDQAVDGADQRQIESYAVPASMVAVSLGLNDADTAATLRGMLQEAKDDEPVEPDQVILIKDILGCVVQMGQSRMTVGQVIEHVCDFRNDLCNRQDWKKTLEQYGIKVVVTGSKPRVYFRYQAIKAKLLTNTRWAEESLHLFLKRIEGHEHASQIVGKVKGRCIGFELGSFLSRFINGGEEEEDDA